MTSGWVARWPLRLRVAAAFLATTAAALLGLGVFVELGVADTLEERLRESLEAEADQLEALPADAQDRAVGTLVGETFAQVLVDGEVAASSPLVGDGPLVDPGVDVASGNGEAYVERDVNILDDDALIESGGDRETDTEAAVLMVRDLGVRLLVVGTSREDTEESVAEVRSQLLVGAPLALLLAGGLGYVVAGAGLRPIERMRARAETISDRSAGERLPLPAAQDELRRLAVTLNAMLDRLDAGLERERRFVADASHELRTPLTLMLTELELALARPRSPEELAAALRSAEEETRRLISLSENLLLLAAADSGRLPLRLATTDLADLAREVVERFRAAAQAGSRPLTLLTPDAVEVEADRVRLDQVLSNLVDNALRHGGGPVEVAVATEPGAVTVTVTDHGPGFVEADPFERFAGITGSAGLGLSIALEVVRAHGGELEVRRADGRTSVRVALPSPSLDP